VPPLIAEEPSEAGPLLQPPFNPLEHQPGPSVHAFAYDVNRYVHAVTQEAVLDNPTLRISRRHA